MNHFARVSVLTCLLSISLGAACGDDPTLSVDAGTVLPDAGPQSDAAADAGTPADLTVSTAQGSLHGKLSSGVRAFLGIPYGAPPVADQRWREPSPAPSWTGTREATAYGASCAQNASGGMPSSAEDCLFLNVFTPELSPSAPLPVMVWLHGGAYVFGSGGPPYQGDKLVQNGNVIVVTVNYRLGSIGFFAHPALTAEAAQRGKAPGNFGVLDQRLALQWVRDNIAAFGGDSSNVTLFGESAGANSICLHLMSEGSRGLFQRAIIQSGLCMKPALTLKEAETAGERYATAMGCTDPEHMLTCLRALSSSAITAGPTTDVLTPGGVFYQEAGKSVYAPMVDGTVIKEQPEAAFAAGRIAHVPVLHGTNTNEGVLFHAGVFGDVAPKDMTEYEAALRMRFGDRAPDVAARYPAMNLVPVTTDSIFRCPAVRMASYLTAAGVPNYLYRFNLALETPVPSLVGQAFHSADVPYVFGNNYSLGSVPADRATAVQTVMAYWTRFAKAGDPNAPGAQTTWPAYDAQKPHLNLEVPFSVGQDWGADCDFWKDIPVAPL